MSKPNKDFHRKVRAFVYLCKGEYAYSVQTIDTFKLGLFYLNLAATYLHRIDYLLEGDDGEDTFHCRLKEDLEKLVGGERG